MRTSQAMAVFLAGAIATGPGGARAEEGQPLLVDKGVRLLRTCRLEPLSFRTAKEGWLMDYCGTILRTEDGGVSWRTEAKGQSPMEKGLGRPLGETEHFTFLRWFDERRAVGGGYIGHSVVVTEDAGLHWQSATVPSSQWVYAQTAVGDRIWTCGSAGAIVRSLDAGRHWEQLKTPFDPTLRCHGLSFVDASDGWAVLGDGSLWKTSDGGTSWTLLRPRVGSHDYVAPALLRFDARRAFLRSTDGAFETNDGGLTWQARDLMTLEGAKPTVVATAAGPVAANCVAGACWPLRNVSAIRSDGTLVIVEDDRLRIIEGGDDSKVLPIATPPVGVTEALVRVRTSPEGTRYGWSRERIYQSHDGQHWAVWAAAPTPVANVLPLATRVVVQTTDGELWDAEPYGRSWTRSESPEIDAYELAQADGRTDLVHPMDCLLRESSSRLEMVFGVQGCFGGDEQLLVLERSGEAATFAGGTGEEGRSGRTTELRAPSSIATPVAQEMISKVLPLVIHPEQTSGCGSTNQFFAELKWRCGKDATHRARFVSYECVRDMSMPGTRTEGPTSRRPSWARAVELTRLGRALLESQGLSKAKGKR